MKEFGSDFHCLRTLNQEGSSIRDYFSNATFYASGRHPIIDLYRQNAWKCLWVPEYFCYEVLASLEREGVKLRFYPDYPLANDRDILRGIHFEKGDALLRVNYFGLRSWRTNQGVPVPVIEDHTHDLIGEWAANSDADWCIASLRKTIPLAEGGILWSPKGLKLKHEPDLTQENENLASRRWNAMRKKALYLDDKIADKNEFRIDMLSTEEEIEKLRISKIDKESADYLNGFDIDLWYRQKIANREIFKGIVDQIGGVKILEPENSGCNPFSLTMLFDTGEERDSYRVRLIERNVYPAVLWNIPENQSQVARNFSGRMLSIHCDARYSIEDMVKLRSIISGCLN